MEKPMILVVEDDPHMLGLLKAALEQNGFTPLPAPDCERALAILEKASVDLAVVDYKLPQATSGLELARRIRQQGTPIILITGYSTEELAIESLREGINDYFPKPFAINALLGSIQRLLRLRVPGSRPTMATHARKTSGLIGGHLMVGDSARMQEIKAYIGKIASTDVSILITGETGTGKELVAELIHKNSGRAMKPFVCFNCAAIPDTLLESEMFGYERGAFTGAYASQDGKLKLAEGGTVFLDEIGDMSLSTQAKMLRVVDKKAIQRLGGQREVTLDVRMIAATNHSLEDLIASGRFRRDLYYRLNVAQIILPPLRHRKADIPLLLQRFVTEFNHRLGKQIEGIAQEALDQMLYYDWPGNIRELKNVTEACMLSLDSGKVGLADIPDHCRSKLAGGATNERELLLSALFSTKWNKSLAAQKLHWSRMTVYRKIAKYQLVPGG